MDPVLRATFTAGDYSIEYGPESDSFINAALASPYFGIDVVGPGPIDLSSPRMFLEMVDTHYLGGALPIEPVGYAGTQRILYLFGPSNGSILQGSPTSITHTVPEPFVGSLLAAAAALLLARPIR